VLPLFVLGGGSNLLVSDHGFDGLVLQVALAGTPAMTAKGDAVRYTVPAGNDWDGFVLSVCEQGIAGLECLAGIPGLVGGTPVQNVGAYGEEISGQLTEVRAFDQTTREFVTLSNAECRFAYRTSRFNTVDRGRYIVTAVTFELERDAQPNLSYGDLKQYFAQRHRSTAITPLEVYHAVRDIRHGKGMLLVEGEPDCRSAGSFFKNPVVSVERLARIAATVGLSQSDVPNWPASDGRTKLPAAWLVEHAGFHKGFALGAAGISSRHTLALVNRGHATQAEMVALRDLIMATVQNRFGVALEQEPVML